MAEKSMASDPTQVNFVNNQPPAPPPYSGPQQGPTNVTYVTTTPVTVVPVRQVAVGPIMGYHSSYFTCRNCNAEVMTRTEAKPTTKTHLFALLLCIFGLWPCVCIPYCMDTCQSVDHYCPNCNAYVGTSN